MLIWNNYKVFDLGLGFFGSLQGSCCDLRQHECKSHNRGLNNKCYDDCMCEEGEWKEHIYTAL